MNWRRRIKITAAIILISCSVYSQNINGIVNDYSEVTVVDYCNNRAVLTQYSNFNAGDICLLIQMKDASIDQSATGTYGTVTNLNNCGLYEILTVASRTSNLVTFQETMINRYDINGGVQLVKIPQYVNVTIDSLTAMPWTGTRGGIAIISASGTVTMNGNINVTGKGFLGGDTLNSTACYGAGLGFTGYECNLAGDCGAHKGEGIFTSVLNDYGMGAPANGGGGGNDFNSGGGGGGNFGIGGAGGSRMNVGAGSCMGSNPGLGAHGLNYSAGTPRAFMGGGGGAGDMDNHTGTAGGQGGGMVIIIAGTFDGAGKKILANGASVDSVAHTDAAGGGGGGGTVMLSVGNYLNSITIETKGGKGGDTDNGNSGIDCFGPGGGGGGGMLWVSGATFPVQIAYTSSPGSNGTTLNGNAPAACGNNGATSGSNGSNLLGLTIPQSLIQYIPLTETICADTLICIGHTAQLYANATGTPTLTYLWSNGDNTLTTTVSPTVTTQYFLTITDVRGCSIERDMTVYVSDPVIHIIITPSDSIIIITPSDSIIIGSVALLSADDFSFTTYHWSPNVALSDTDQFQTVANPLLTQTYCLDVVNSIGCPAQDCQTLYVVPPPPNVFFPTCFTPNGDGKNDLFFPIPNNACFHMLEFTIYNRWGQEEYRRTNSYEGWDGTNKFGEKCQMGEYVYVARAECEGHEQIFKGSVLLIK